MNKVLVLGAGLVAKPLVEYLAKVDGVELSVADIIVSKAQNMVSGFNNAKAIDLDIKDDTIIETLIKQHDITVSLLPATMHLQVAKLCLKHKKHMTTASYISAEMKALSDEAAQSDLTFVNECGVDPGLDHMSAMRVIHQIESNGGKVVSFRSYCGGLPAPDANTNPIGYKFSWAPRGVLVAATNQARYLQDGNEIEIPGDELFASPEIVNFPEVGDLEGYPNRNSLPYIEMYGLKDVKTMFRGTLRNSGHCSCWYHWVKLGLFEAGNRSDLNGLTYKRFMQGFVEGAGNIKHALSEKWNIPQDASAITNLEWLGMFHESAISIKQGGNVDILASRLSEKCRYKDGEKDMIAMQHEFIADFDGATKKIYSTLVDFGIPNGDTSMARTVSLPLAIATRMLLDGRLTLRGVIAPVDPAVYNPILDELETMGIAFSEREE